MSDLIDRGEASQFTFLCPTCHIGILDTASGTAQHTPLKLTWVGITCPNCRRSFSFDATRGIPALPPHYGS